MIEVHGSWAASISPFRERPLPIIRSVLIFSSHIFVETSIFSLGDVRFDGIQRESTGSLPADSRLSRPRICTWRKDRPFRWCLQVRIIHKRKFKFNLCSLGITTFAVFNKGLVPIKYNGRLDNLKRNADKVSRTIHTRSRYRSLVIVEYGNWSSPFQFKSVPETCMQNIPFALRDDYKQCLNYTPDLRPDATQFTKVS